jgi:hypothetical protein
MRILFLTFYYRPDLSAGSFRATNLVKALLAVQLPAAAGEIEIDVLTTSPNRYHTFQADAAAVERDGRVTVYRCALPAHKSGVMDQAKSFMAYAQSVRSHVRGRRYDLVFATSSRLMTAVLGSWASRRLSAPLYLDIRDIFVDTISDVFAGMKATAAKPVFSRLERYAVTRATRVNLVSEGFRSYFATRYPHGSYAYFTNGIDPEFMSAAGAPSAQQPAAAARADSRVNVVYAGNMGEGQGLHRIIPELASRTAATHSFTLIGDGGRRAALEAAVAAAGCTNVAILSPVPRAQLIDRYRAADVLFLHLNAMPAFERVLPSKIFEYAAMGRPIWAGVGGYAAEFLRRHVENAAVFPPCDAGAAMKAFSSLRLEPTPRADFLTAFDRATICARMAQDIVATAS